MIEWSFDFDFVVVVVINPARVSPSMKASHRIRSISRCAPHSWFQGVRKNRRVVWWFMREIRHDSYLSYQNKHQFSYY